MRTRGIDYFIRRMRTEDPSSSIRKKLIRRYKNNSIRKYEPEIYHKLSDVPMEQISFTDPITKEILKWVYVGDLWWCRKRIKGYEFARLVAYKNDPKQPLTEIDGLWDARRHITKQPPVIVYRNNIKGYIVGFSKYDVSIQWEVDGVRTIPEPVRSQKHISFEYIEDYKKFSVIFANIKRYG